MSKRRISVLKGGIFAVIAILLILPVMVVAGSLEPSAAPAPTMKTLDQIPPTWSQKISGAARFEVVLDSAAVLDKETGLVWEKSTSATTFAWEDAVNRCAPANIGGRKGWRLPTIEELASLVDPTQTFPSLPSGHPFINVQSFWYWSSTTYAFDPSYAWGAVFSSGLVYSSSKSFNGGYVRCVRGGQ